MRHDHIPSVERRLGPRDLRQHPYTPSGSWTGTDSSKYTITDTSALVSNEVTATVTVYPPPTAVPTPRRRTRRGRSIPVQADDTLPAGSATTSIVATSSNGTAAVSGGNLTFTPNANYSGTTSFTYRLTDVYGNTSNTVTVTVNVKPTASPLASSGTGVGKSTTRSVATPSMERSAGRTSPRRARPEAPSLPAAQTSRTSQSRGTPGRTPSPTRSPTPRARQQRPPGR